MITYITSGGDTWDMIAFTIYGDVTYTEFLMNNNQSKELLATVIFDAGVVINTPALPETLKSNPGTPPWRS